MFRKLRDIPEELGNINGVDYEADIRVRPTTNEKLLPHLMKHLEGAEHYSKINNITLGKEYHVHRINALGDIFDVVIIDDKGNEKEYCSWIFEDID